MDYTIHPIAHIRTDFTDKFGIPRQSGLEPELTARIVFEPEYRDPNALVGIEGYDRLWLIWQFSTVAAEYAAGKSWRPTVRPPRLGGNERRGGGASGQHGLVGIFDESVELAQREFPRLALPGKVRSYGLGRIEGVRQLVLKPVGRKARLDHDGSGDRFPAALGARVSILERGEGRAHRATVASARSFFGCSHQLLSR